MKHIPNILTLIRILMVPMLPYVFFNFNNGRILGLFIFLLAGITDVLDGFIARKFNAISNFGIALDPLADKLMLLTVLICLYISNDIPFIILFIMIIKEFTLIVLGSLLYFKKEKTTIPANFFGKTATFLFSIAIILTFLYPNESISNYSVIIAVISKLLAFTMYLYNYLRNHNKKTD